MRPSLTSIRVLLVGASIAAAAFAGCAKGATLGTGPGGDGGDGEGGSGATGHQGGATTGTGGAGMTSTTTTTTTATTTSTTSTTSTTTTTSTTATTTVTTGGGGACDGTGLCDTCVNCAVDIGGPCEIEYLLCSLDFECLDFSDCLSFCPAGDQACVDNCVQLYPFGAQLYSDFAYCAVCNACYSDCDGAGSGC